MRMRMGAYMHVKDVKLIRCPPPPPPHQLDQLVEKERLGCFIIWHYPMDAVFFPLCSVLPVNGKKRSIEKQALIGVRVVAITAYLDFRS